MKKLVLLTLIALFTLPAVAQKIKDPDIVGSIKQNHKNYVCVGQSFYVSFEATGFDAGTQFMVTLKRDGNPGTPSVSIATVLASPAQQPSTTITVVVDPVIQADVFALNVASGQTSGSFKALIKNNIQTGDALVGEAVPFTIEARPCPERISRSGARCADGAYRTGRNSGN